MRIVDLNKLSEEEREKVLEEQQTMLEQRQQASAKLQRQGNQKFNELVNKSGEYDTNKHTTTIGNIQNAYRGSSDYNNIKKSLNTFYRNNNTNSSLWEQIKERAGFTAKKTGAGILSGIAGIGQGIITDTANNMKKGEKEDSNELIRNLVNSFSSQSPTDYMMKNLPNYAKKQIESLKDKDKNGIEKAVSFVNNAVSEVGNSYNNKLGVLSELVGKISPNTSEELLKANNKISEPINEINNQLDRKSEKYGTVANTIANVGQAIGNMTPSILSSVITKNPNVGLATMGLSSKGQSTQEALNRGAELDKAVKIGNTKAMIEVGTEMLTGGVNIFGKGALDDIAEKGILSKVKSNVGKAIAKQGINVAGETLEETISDILGTVIDKETVNPNAKYTLKDWGDTAITTTLTTLVLNSLGIAGDIKSISNENKANKNAQNWINEAQNIINNNTTQNLQQNTVQNQSILPIQQITQQENKTAQNGNMEQNNINEFNGYTQKEIDNIKSNKISIAQSNEDISNFVNNSRKVPGNFKMYLGKITENVSNTIKSTLGINVDNYNISLKTDDVRKIFKDHGSEKTEIPRGQVPITENDFLNIPNIINNPDIVSEAGKSPQDKPVIKFEKNINGNNVVVTYVSDKHNNLELQTMYKFKNNKKIDSATALHENQTPGLNTSEMDSGTNLIINNSIPQNEQNVKDTITNNYMQNTENNTVENNQNSLYNINNESESDINGRINQRNDGTSRLFKESTEKQREYSWDEYNKWEESIKPTENITNKEQQSINKSKSEHNKDVFLYDENDNDNTYSGGASRNVKNKINISRQQAEYFGLDFMIDHETIESDILQNQELYEDIVNPVIEKIQKDNNFKKQVDEFWRNEEGNKPSDRLIAKDIFCDRFAQMRGNELKYENILSQETNMNIDYALNNFYKEIYGKEIEDSNKSSFNLPTKEDVKTKLNLPTKEKMNQPTQGEKINWNEIERPEGKIRKHYRSIIESGNTTKEAKAIAKELMGSDTYVPESNIKQLDEADRRISENGADNELKALTLLSDRLDSRITANDIAVGERLIEYYSKIGDKAKLQEAIQTTAMAGTQAGQTVQALSLLNHQTPQGQVTWIQRSVDKMNKELVKKRGENAQQFDFTPEMQQKIMETTNQQEMNEVLDEIYKELGQQVSKTRIQQLDSWRYFSMLANPRTHIRNIVGNVAMGKTQSVKNRVAGAIEGTVAKFNPEMERTHTLKPASKEVKQFAKNDIVNVEDRLELNDNKYNPKSRLENSMRTFKSDAMENTLGKAFEMNEKALEVEDAWGLKSGYVKALSEYMTANKLTPENITDKQLAKARNYAIEEAKEATFHSQNAIATAINQFSRKNKLTKGVTDAVLPFVKTPMNVAKAGIEYNPAGLIKTLTADTVKLRKGDITINKYIDNLSKGLTGTGIAVLGYAMAEAGILKASGGDDDKKEKYDESLGNQAYSIQIGDTTYSLDWLAPAGIPLFVGAEAHNINKSGKNEKSSISNDDDKKSKQIIDSLENWANAMSNSMSPMSEMSMISGLTSALKSYDQDSTKMLGQMGTNAVKSYVNQYVPTALGQVAKTTDKYERSTTSTKTGILSKAIDQTKLQVMSKVPGLRQQLPVRTDIWGKEQEQEGNILPINNRNKKGNIVTKAIKNGVVPFTIKNINNSEVDKELNNLYKKTGESSIIPTTSLEKKFTINGQDYRMTNEEYNKYRNSYGKTSYQLLEKIIKSNDYKNLSNEQKQKAIENVYSYAKESNKMDYAKNNKLECEQSTLYTTMQDLKNNGGSQSEYLNYLSKTTELNKDKDKNQILVDSNYTDKTKAIIYRNTTGKEDELYNNLLSKDNINININEYLKYKLQEFESDRKDDGTTNGEAISGSKKKKVYSYVNNMNITKEQRLILLGMQYKLSNTERTELANLINKLPNTSKEEKMKLYEKMQGFTVYKNGTIKW